MLLGGRFVLLQITNDYRKTAESFEKTLRIGENFDVISRKLSVNSSQATLYFIDGLVKGGDFQKLLIYLVELTDFGDGKDGAAERFKASKLPDVEVDVTNDSKTVLTSLLGGCVVMISDGFDGNAIIIDLRTYPSRDTQDPENDRVMRGARDGFVETLMFNTALIRRRIRDVNLTMKYCTVGSRSRTDVVIAYIEGVADDKYVKKLISSIEAIETDALPLGHQSLIEALVKKQWYNPFPKVRMTERPDAASAHILEGGIAVLCDTSPEALLLPTSVFDFLQETNDFYFPPVTGSYLRVMRTLIFVSTIFITPVWYLAMMYSERLPASLSFLIPTQTGELPVIVQLFLTELALDALKLASLTTPSTMSNSLSIIGGLLLGDFAVQAGWVIPEVIFYMAFTSIANFTQSNYELGYAFKYFRMLILLLTAIFGILGFVIGTAVVIVLVCMLKGICGESYLYPLVPYNGKALKRLLLRMKKQ